jgi:hypothetical protein
MIISRYYYEILGISPTADRSSVKKAYHQRVRENHPDFFPEEKKNLQELKIIEIIEAYRAISESLSGTGSPTGGPPGRRKEQSPLRPEEVSPSRPASPPRTSADPEVRPPRGGTYRPAGPTVRHQLGPHRDVQYAYYKQGFLHYSCALSGIARIERNVKHRNDIYYLRRFARSLFHLRKADLYFCNLVNQFPASIWSRDAWIKIRRIEYFHRLYRKILHNIEARLRERLQRAYAEKGG